MYRKFQARIVGMAPMLQHNVQLSDPLNHWSKLISKVAKKRTKTDEDHETLSRLEWRGSIYERDGQIVLPGVNIKAAIRDAGKTRKKGKDVKRSVLITDDFALAFDGDNASIDEMNEDPSMRVRLSMKVGTSRVMRTFPRLSNWSVDFDGIYHPKLMDAEELADLLDLAGAIDGLGDLRPTYGRFQVTSFEHE